MSKGRSYQPTEDRRKANSHIKHRPANRRSFKMFWRHDFFGRKPIRQSHGARKHRRRAAKEMYMILVKKHKGYARKPVVRPVRHSLTHEEVM